MNPILTSRFLVNKAKPWLRTVGFFGTTGGIAFLYVTDWKLINQFIPIYNTKFKTEE